VNAQLGIEEILANPAAFGLKNTTSECILVPACVNGGAAVQDTYLFWDEVHPTTGIHDYLARVIANQLLAGATIGGEAELMLAQARDFSDHLGQRMGDLRLSVPELGQVNTYVEGIYGFGDRAGGGVSRGFSYNAGTVVAGADVQVLPGLILGGAFGYGQPGARFDNGAGQLAYHAYQGGVYATGFTQLAYADVAASYSGFSAGSGERPAVLPGEAIGFAPAGHGWTLRGGTGLTLHEARLIWGPVAGLSYTHAIVGAYGESGSEIGEPLLTQSVAHQTADSLVGQAGLRAATTLRLGGLAVAPHALLAAEREFLDGTRSVETEFFSAGLPVYDRLAGYTRTYGRAGVGLAANMTRMLTGTVDFQSSFGRGNGEDRALVAKLTATF
jgi:outer membrane lipase/esterase